MDGTIVSGKKLVGDLGAVLARDGKSAYEIAKDTGFVGTEEEWIESLHGADGTVAFEELTEEQRESLRGEPGYDYVLTDEDKQEIADMVYWEDATVPAEVTEHITRADNPHGVTAAQIGAAPAGFGYGGEQLPAIEGTTTDEINAGILELIKAMPRLFCTRQFKCKNPVTISGHLYGTIYKQNDSNAIVVLYQIAYRYELRGQYTQGVWEEWEWSNQPMSLATEYRTTERFNGKPVYTKLINAGYLPSSRLSKWVTVSEGRVDVVEVKAFMTRDDGGYFPFPCHHNNNDEVSAYIAYAAYIADQAKTLVNIIPTKDMSAYAAYVTVKYTKNETT